MIRLPAGVLRAFVGLCFVSIGWGLGATPMRAQACPLCDLGELARWLEGDFERGFEGDFEAVLEGDVPAAAEGAPCGETAPSRVRTILTPIRLRDLGARVFYAEQHECPAGRPGDETIRQWIYSFEFSEADETIVQRIYELDAPEIYLGAHEDKKRFRELSVGEVEELAGCAVTWRREGESFLGTARPGACSEHAARARIVEVSRSSIWLLDGEADGERRRIELTRAR